MGFSTYSTQYRQVNIPPTAYLSKLPNIMLANNSTYTVQAKATLFDIKYPKMQSQEHTLFIKCFLGGIIICEESFMK